MKQRVYIAGKVTGLPLEIAKQNFAKAERAINELNYQAVNPMRIVPEQLNNDWNSAMKICINELIDCDAIYLIPNWRDSKGARIEEKIAREMGKQFIEQKPKLEKPKLFTYKNPQ